MLSPDEHSSIIEDLENLLQQQLSFLEKGQLDSALELSTEVDKLVLHLEPGKNFSQAETKVENIKMLFSKVMLSLQDSKNEIRLQLGKINDGKQKISLYRQNM